ncbi:hypothetical protein [Rivularia sp. UHCC 0363]|uniref:hypothetical protein n=1 Tax=Rivularia sp. UHCC 0363 TaxID=3110244 RepID=UPI002B1F7868|nr:hypothetical protein [Rivularia sp. UHCC 0363]MEA5599343.1 hypothetical protein [Rivularia sp. UHCC 0363]
MNRYTKILIRYQKKLKSYYWTIFKLLKKCYPKPEPENHGEEKSLYEKFEETGLISCCSVEENLSTSYKEILANTLVTKYDHS